MSAPNHHAVLLNVLDTPTGPSHTIIGPPGPGNVYSNADGSIAGNGPHNPFLNQTADFTITFPLPLLMGVTVTSATFSFGTTAGNNVNGVLRTTAVPEPNFSGTLALGLGFLLIAVGRHRKGIEDAFGGYLAAAGSIARPPAGSSAATMFASPINPSSPSRRARSHGNSARSQ